ncbi:hypothetical protein [Pseudomonas amygdali]|uniref:SMI1/KNR4 family protein n=2 Tax=Pseudomonas amygdali pv. lachrymans TaxID=53707 RepID=A0ABR5KSG7_PSEAV|nr:hypothetical protein [Pseudomonas amygdali]AXH60056.1 hypothetical protein PLA107_033060 [Pseudomonas amygdali pv. lachrymans str. M301315]KPC17461.1 Uncharacterized protein AC499_0663 [Pseudomonas amygdali pv. lachrymans]RMT06147.1 hypothetical protein ALP54_03909 [Pseudomonas amygdali pv. lachrymans]
MSNFKSWFKATYNVEMPEDLVEYLSEKPDGASSEAATLYGPEDIMAYTEERELEEKGFLYLGTGNMLDVLLLQVADGQVFLVDQTDYQNVDASFRSLTVLRNLLDLQ